MQAKFIVRKILAEKKVVEPICRAPQFVAYKKREFPSPVGDENESENFF